MAKLGSKEPEQYEAMTFFCRYSYNFCWPVRALRIQDVKGSRSIKRTPAMTAGLTDHVDYGRVASLSSRAVMIDHYQNL